MRLSLGSQQLSFLYLAQTLSWLSLFMMFSGMQELALAISAWLSYPAILYLSNAVTILRRRLADTVALLFAAWVVGLAIFLGAGGQNIVVYTSALPIALVVEALSGYVAETEYGANLGILLALPPVMALTIAILIAAAIEAISAIS